MPSGLQLIHSKVGWIVAGETSLENLMVPANTEKAQGAKNPLVEDEEKNALLGKVKKKEELNETSQSAV